MWGFVALALVALAACSDLRAGQLLRTANALGAQGKWDEAIHYYERIWVEFPASDLTDEARLRAARLQAGPAHRPMVAAQLYRALATGARTPETQMVALIELAELYRTSWKDPAHAIEVLEIAVRRFPDRPETAGLRIDLARLYLDGNRFTQALLTLEPLLDTGGEVGEQARLLAAQAHELSEHPDAAHSYYERIVEQTTPGSDAWIAAHEGLARLEERADDWPQALQRLRQLQTHHPNPDAIERWIVAIQERHADMNR